MDPRICIARFLFDGAGQQTVRTPHVGCSTSVFSFNSRTVGQTRRFEHRAGLVNTAASIGGESVRECAMLHQHIAVICVQNRDDERTDRFVVFSSALPVADWRQWPQSMPHDVTCTTLIGEAQVRSELATGGLSAEEIDARVSRARAFKTTTTSDTLFDDWVNAISRLLPRQH